MSTNEDDLLARIKARRAALAPAGDDLQGQIAARRAALTESPGQGEGLVRAALQGATLGFGDEIASGISALGAGARNVAHVVAPSLVDAGPSMGEAYDAELERERGRMAEFGSAHPIENVVANMGGAVATGKLLGPLASKAASAVAKAGTFGHAAAEGAIFGGAAGAGSSEGGLAPRLKGLAGGAVLGAGVGTAVRGLAAGAGAALDASGLRPSRPVPVPTAGATAVERPSSGLVTSLEDRADERILEAMKRDKLTTDAVRKMAADNPDKPLALVDAGDEEGNLLGLARAAKTLPGEAKRDISAALRERSAGELGRVRADLVKRTGLPQEFSEDTADQIVQQRKANAAPLYAKLDDMYIKDPDQTFTKILDDPAFAEAYKRAGRIAKREGYKVPDLYDENGNFQGNKSIPVRVFDYINRGLRDMKQGQNGFGPDEWRSIQGKRNELLQHVDELVPEFKQARAVYAGDSALLDALDEGGDLFKSSTDPRAAAARLKSMTPDERNMYRRRAIDDLLSNLGDQRDMSDQAGRMTGTPNLRDKVRLLFDKPEDADAFLADAKLESRMNTSRTRLAGGSPTAEILADQASAMGGRHQIPTSAGGLLRLGGRLAGNAVMRAQGLTGKTSQALAERLTAGVKSRDDLEAVLKLLDDLAAKRAGQAAAGSTAVRAGSGLLGQLAGGK